MCVMRIGGRAASGVAWACFLVVGAPAQGQAPPPSPRYLGAFVREIPGFKAPRAAAIDRDGLIFIADTGGHRVRVHREDGTLVREWGRYGRGAGEFIGPAAIAIGPDERVYVADHGNHRIQVFDREGRPLAAWGAYGSMPGEFNQPQGIAVDGRGSVYVADTENARVQVFDAAGVHQRVLGAYGEGAGRFLCPVDVAIDGGGGVYVVDVDANCVQHFDADGRAAGRWGDWGNTLGFFNEPSGIVVARPAPAESPGADGAAGPSAAADADGAPAAQLYVTDRVNHRVQVFALDGRPLYAWGLHALRPREGAGKLHYPTRTAIAPSGRFAVVCEPIEDRVQIFGLRDRPTDDAAMLIPPGDNLSFHYGMRLDIAGTLLAIAEQDGDNMLAFDIRGPDPIEINRFGGYGGAHGQFRRPGGLCLDASAERLLVSDLAQRRVQWFRFTRDPSAELKMLPEMTAFVKAVRLEAPSGEAGDRSTTETVVPTAMTRDAAGLIYAIDERRCEVLVFDEALRFVRRFGGYGDGPGRFLRPTDLAIDRRRAALFVVDAAGRRVTAHDLDGGLRGVILTSESGLDEPFGVAVDDEGNVYVTDVGAHRVMKTSPAGERIRTWGGHGLGAGEFVKPRGIAVDDRGRVFVIDHGNHRGQIFDRDGRFLNAFGARLFVMPVIRAAASRPASRPASAPASAAASQPDDARLADDAAAHEIRSNDGTYVVRYRTTPSPIPLNEPFAVEFRVRWSDAAKSSPPDVKVLVDAAMPEHQHGMNVQPKLIEDGPAAGTARGMLFHMPGRWELYFDITRNGVTERAQTSIELE